MRVIPVIAMLIAALLLTLAPQPDRPLVWAQLGAPPAPLPAPPLPPAAAPTAGTLAAPAPPLLAPAPGASAALVRPTPGPSNRIFNCSCFGPASPTRWMGQVQASSYFTARENAVNSCIAYNFNRRPSSAFVPPPVFLFFPTPAPPINNGFSEPGLPNLQAPGLSGFGLLNSPRAIVLRLCAECTCN
ncbi:MAG: hypothetical protein IVW54_16455 [Candidatus Binataceae bacterium]|nr:hypothetical protein [Candidatus Binataceae bacterium]